MGMASGAIPPFISPVVWETREQLKDRFPDPYISAEWNSSAPKPSDVAKTAASRVAVVETEDDLKDYEADKLLHEVYTRKEEMRADLDRLMAAYKKDEE